LEYLDIRCYTELISKVGYFFFKYASDYEKKASKDCTMSEPVIFSPGMRLEIRGEEFSLLHADPLMTGGGLLTRLNFKHTHKTSSSAG